MNYLSIAQHYDNCFKLHGDNHKGTDWPNLPDVFKRYDVMLNIIREKKDVTLLDFGCGTAELNNYIISKDINNIIYSGLDINFNFYETSRKKFPYNDFYHKDIMIDDSLPNFDYIVCNGVFTEKLSLSQEEMFLFFSQVINKLWSKCNYGISFNLMSKLVDWERDDLFHVGFDFISSFIQKNLSRHYVIKNDYGLYEYTIYVYKHSLN